MKKKLVIAVVVLVVAVAFLGVAYESSQTNPYLILPSSNTVYGVTEDDVYAGVIHVEIGPTNPPTQQWIETYCVQRGVDIYSGIIYQYTQAPATDNTEFRAVGYITTWWHTPGTYAPNGTYTPFPHLSAQQAGSIQDAIWYFTNGVTPPSGNATTIVNDSTGKDIVRSTDTLTLTSGSTITPLGSVTLTATLTQSNGTARPNVLVVFNLSDVGSVTSGLTAVTQWNVPTGYTYEGVTNAAGEIQFTINYGGLIAGTTMIYAYTKGLWPEILYPYRIIRIGTSPEQCAVTLSTLVEKTAQLQINY